MDIGEVNVLVCGAPADAIATKHAAVVSEEQLARHLVEIAALGDQVAVASPVGPRTSIVER